MVRSPLVLVLILQVSLVAAFRPSSQALIRIAYRSVLRAEPEKPKGFGKAKEPLTVKKEEEDVGSQTYALQAKRGVPEYNIFFRPVNGTDTDWVPVGSMASRPCPHTS
jgi:hypothetical protein